MNLSQRLDQARARQSASTPTASYELRMARDAQVYDGTHLRTGQEMTSDRWEKVRHDEGGLPTWNPRRANDLVSDDPLLDLTGAGADVIDLRSRQSAAGVGDEVFEMPAWARREQVFRGDTER